LSPLAVLAVWESAAIGSTMAPDRMNVKNRFDFIDHLCGMKPRYNLEVVEKGTGSTRLSVYFCLSFKELSD